MTVLNTCTSQPHCMKHTPGLSTVPTIPRRRKEGARLLELKPYLCPSIFSGRTTVLVLFLMKRIWCWILEWDLGLLFRNLWHFPTLAEEESSLRFSVSGLDLAQWRGKNTIPPTYTELDGFDDLKYHLLVHTHIIKISSEFKSYTAARV